MLSVFVLGAGLSIGAAAADSASLPPLPIAPVVVEAAPLQSAGHLVLAANGLSGLDSESFDHLLSLTGYQVDTARDGDAAVPRIYAASMPPDMAAIASSDDRKRIFIKLMLPLVLDANERLLVDRARLLYLAAREDSGLTVSFTERRWRAAMYEAYGVEPGDRDELLARVDVIPPSMMLAQAAQETGWGTSRFVHEGNALFGQRIWEAGAGMVPDARASGENHEVRAFDGLRESVFAYMVNLNSHDAYASFRDLRAFYRDTDRALDGYLMATGLDGYSEEGQAYVDKIRAIIRSNDLTDFDSARLADLAL
ncbi:MAG: glucosaminidase domain-containing protein [Pseudomonadota bacterium]